jgi:hypothetical protein
MIQSKRNTPNFSTITTQIINIITTKKTQKPTAAAVGETEEGCAWKLIEASIPIWNSPWIPAIPSFSPSPISPRIPNSSNMVVIDLINQNASWNIPLISSLFDIHSILVLGKSRKLPSILLLVQISYGLLLLVNFPPVLLIDSLAHKESPLIPLLLNLSIGSSCGI